VVLSEVLVVGDTFWKAAIVEIPDWIRARTIDRDLKEK
jgi:hypothetical protein